ncbi:MAG TPA: hypothetical protein VH044_12450 [Polyangiaceae bacterium]|nr:hypothetical protein [Polyangiaceae bacterium]
MSTLLSPLSALSADRLARRIARFTRGEAALAVAAAPRVALADGADENGLAVMLGDLVRQNLEAKPRKMADFMALAGSVAIVADDADVALTLVFAPGARGGMTIHDGIVGIPDVTIRGPSEAILALSNMPLATPLGLPLPGLGDPEAMKTVRDLAKAVREGKLHFYGMFFHLPLVMKLTRVMSVNG